MLTEANEKLQSLTLDNETQIKEMEEKMVEEFKSSREKERDMMMQVVMRNLIGGIRVGRVQESREDEEEEMLMRAIEESKREAGIDENAQPDTDNMSYE